jgi:uncharacterized damage-inducible protein DinB
MTGFPEPSGATSDARELFDRYLVFYRETVLRKLRSLPEESLGASMLPSGWTPLELLTHLVHMEHRWFTWGFSGAAVLEPWGDDRDGRWHVGDDVTLDDLAVLLVDQGRRTSRVLAEHDLAEQAPPGPRYPQGEPATLAWTCFHVLQEYARHAGHLDVAVELAGGDVGE